MRMLSVLGCIFFNSDNKNDLVVMRRRSKILLIEDHKPVRILLSNFLKKDFELFCVDDGFKALAWMSKGNIPDLILLDMNLPILDGPTFLSNIKGSGFFKNIPIILITGELDWENTLEPWLDKIKIDLVSEHYIKKPFDPNEVKTKILSILNKLKETTQLQA